VDSDAIGQLLITSSVFVKYLRKKWEHNEAVHQFFIDFKKAYDSVWYPQETGKANKNVSD